MRVHFLGAVLKRLEVMLHSKFQMNKVRNEQSQMFLFFFFFLTCNI